MSSFLKTIAVACVAVGALAMAGCGGRDCGSCCGSCKKAEAPACAKCAPGACMCPKPAAK